MRLETRRANPKSRDRAPSADGWIPDPPERASASSADARSLIPPHPHSSSPLPPSPRSSRAQGGRVVRPPPRAGRRAPLPRPERRDEGVPGDHPGPRVEPRRRRAPLVGGDHRRGVGGGEAQGRAQGAPGGDGGQAARLADRRSRRVRAERRDGAAQNRRREGRHLARRGRHPRERSPARRPRGGHRAARVDAQAVPGDEHDGFVRRARGGEGRGGAGRRRRSDTASPRRYSCTSRRSGPR